MENLSEIGDLESLLNQSGGEDLLSEEIGFLNYNGRYTLILDPIDGTKNAVRGIPFYAVSVAAGRKSLEDIEFGVVINIPSGDVFVAEKGKGAFLNGKAYLYAAVY